MNTTADIMRIDLIGVREVDGSVIATGFLSNAKRTLRVNGTFPPGFATEFIKRPRGRPRGCKKTPEHIATLAHFYMSGYKFPQWGKQSRVLHFRETVWQRKIVNPDNEYKATMDYVREATKFLQSCTKGFVTFVPQNPEEQLFWFAMEDSDSWQCDEVTNSIKVDGIGWMCHWEMRSAVYCRITGDSGGSGKPPM